MRKTSMTAIVFGVLLAGVTGDAVTQGVLTPPPYERGRAGLFTLQMEQSLALGDDNIHHGSWAFRLRKDQNRWAVSGVAGAAFAGDRAALLGIAANIKLFGDSPSLSRWIGGLTADANTVSMNGARITALSGSVAVGREVDTAGFGRSLVVAGRGGYLLADSPGADEGYWGVSLAATIGISQRFQLFSQVDYASIAPGITDSVWTLGTGLRVRIGPG